MKCFLHIGVEKTATKSLQSFLTINRDEFLNNGFYYPKCLGSLNSVKLAVAAYDPKHHDDISMSMGIPAKDVLRLQKFKENTISELSNELQNLRNHRPEAKLVLSSEHFQSRLTRISEIETLRSILEQIGITEVFVIVYLRNPLELAASLYSTAIKSGHYIDTPPAPSNFYFNNVCNHQKTLENYGSIFGDSAMIPRLFHKSEFAARSVFQDFLIALRSNLSEKNFMIPPDMNESLSATGIEILKRVNKLIPRITSEGINPLRGNIVSYFEKHFIHPKYSLPDHIYQQYTDAFQESNEWVRKKYFPEKSALFPNERIPESNPEKLNEAELDCISNLIAEIWVDKKDDSL